MGVKWKGDRKSWTGRHHTQWEARYQREVARFLDRKTNLTWYYASPNVYRAALAVFAPRNYARRAGCKARMGGVKAGVPDICILDSPPALEGSHGAYIELKCKGNSPSKKQKEWMARLKELGYFVGIARDDLDNFKTLLAEAGYDFDGKESFLERQSSSSDDAAS